MIGVSRGALRPLLGASFAPRPRPRPAPTPRVAPRATVPQWWRDRFARAEGRAVGGLVLQRTSGWRSAERNAEVRGQAQSQHLLGTAADYVGSEAAMQEGARRFREVNPTGTALVHDVGSGRHLHVQLFRKGQVPAELVVASEGQ